MSPKSRSKRKATLPKGTIHLSEPGAYFALVEGDDKRFTTAEVDKAESDLKDELDQKIASFVADMREVIGQEPYRRMGSGDTMSWELISKYIVKRLRWTIGFGKWKE